MAANVVVDAGFLLALLVRRDANHAWARARSLQLPLPWRTCEAALAEAFHLLTAVRAPALVRLLRRRALICEFNSTENLDQVLQLMQRYASVPMSFADACVVRMTEKLSDPVVVSVDADFRIYRRHGRRTIPCILPL